MLPDLPHRHTDTARFGLFFNNRIKFSPRKSRLTGVPVGLTVPVVISYHRHHAPAERGKTDPDDAPGARGNAQTPVASQIDADKNMILLGNLGQVWWWFCCATVDV